MLVAPEKPPCKEPLSDAPVADPFGVGNVRAPKVFSKSWQVWLNRLWAWTATQTPRPGVIEMYAGATVPDARALWCDGTKYKQADYPALFSAIGAAWNTGGEGAGEFRVPDLRGRFPFGKATAGTGSTLAALFGAIDHTHTQPNHTHAVSGSTASDGGGALSGAMAGDGGHGHSVSGSTGDAGSHDHWITGGATDSNGAHDHTVSGSTGGPSSTADGGAEPHQVGDDAHSHDVSGTTDSTGAHTHGPGNLYSDVVANHAHGAGTLAADAVGDHIHGNGTLAAAAHTHGAGTLATGDGGNNDTGTANPPAATVNFVIWS